MMLQRVGAEPHAPLRRTFSEAAYAGEMLLPTGATSEPTDWISDAIVGILSQIGEICAANSLISGGTGPISPGTCDLAAGRILPGTAQTSGATEWTSTAI